jgi:hypothetical protein
MTFHPSENWEGCWRTSASAGGVVTKIHCVKNIFGKVRTTFFFLLKKIYTINMGGI